MTEPKREVCNISSRVCYRYEIEALGALDLLRSRQKGVAVKSTGVYRCRFCWRWHLNGRRNPTRRVA